MTGQERWTEAENEKNKKLREGEGADASDKLENSEGMSGNLGEEMIE